MCSRTRKVSGTRPTCNMAPVLIRFSGFVGSPPKTRTFPVLGWHQSQQQFYGGGFAGAVRAQQGDHLAGAHAEIHAAQRSDVAVVLVHALETGDDRVCDGSGRDLLLGAAILFHGCDHFNPPGEFSAAGGKRLRCSHPVIASSRKRRQAHQCHPSRDGRDKCHPHLCF